MTAASIWAISGANGSQGMLEVVDEHSSTDAWSCRSLDTVQGIAAGDCGDKAHGVDASSNTVAGDA